jgi:hypothetical protein
LPDLPGLYILYWHPIVVIVILGITSTLLHKYILIVVLFDIKFEAGRQVFIFLVFDLLVEIALLHVLVVGFCWEEFILAFEFLILLH